MKGTRILRWGTWMAGSAAVLLALASGAACCAQEPAEVAIVDHYVAHVSTVQVNEGEQVKLFVRERFTGNAARKPVILMVTGTTQAAMVPFDVRYVGVNTLTGETENFSWMAFLAEAGFDVFGMDLTGYGLSPRPAMGDPCNVSSTEQRLLIPNPLSESCPPGYAFRLTTSQTDLDEMDTVVDYLRGLRHVDKVNLIGWSLGAPRVGGYAAGHREKVERLFMNAPAYERNDPSEPPAVVPEAGVPMTVRTIASFLSGWNAQATCPNQVTPGVRDAVVERIREFDPVARTWGNQPLWRAPNQSRWGWNAESAGEIEAPTLIIRGELDANVRLDESTTLLEDLGSAAKVFVHVACAAHQIVWENQHMILLRASEEWLRNGTFAGQRNGTFAVDVEGRVHPE